MDTMMVTFWILLGLWVLSFIIGAAGLISGDEELAIPCFVLTAAIDIWYVVYLFQS